MFRILRSRQPTQPAHCQSELYQLLISWWGARATKVLMSKVKLESNCFTESHTLHMREQECTIPVTAASTNTDHQSRGHQSRSDKTKLISGKEQHPLFYQSDLEPKESKEHCYQNKTAQQCLSDQSKRNNVKYVCAVSHLSSQPLCCLFQSQENFWSTILVT